MEILLKMTKMSIPNQDLLEIIQKDTIHMKQALKKDQKQRFNKTGKIFKLLMNITDLTKSIRNQKKAMIFTFHSV